MVEHVAAPAVGPRKINSGRLRVTVRPYYEGPPLSGLVGDGGRVAKATRSRGGKSTHPSLKVTVPRNQKSPRWSAGRRRALR